MTVMDLQITENSNIGFFGDSRLYKRGKKIFNALLNNLSFNIKKISCGNRAEEVAIHRFLSNQKVTAEEIESTITKSTNKNISDLEHILIVNDTTEFAYPTQREKKSSFGPTGNHEIKGLFVHPNIVINPTTNEILGLAGAKIWNRDLENTKADRNKKPIEEKESYKWIESFIKAKELDNSPKKTFVTDRESDIFEYMDVVNKQNDYFVLRLRHDRKLEQEEFDTILKKIEYSPIIDSYNLDLQETPKRKRRTAKVEIKFGEVCLLKPKNVKNKNKYSNNINLFFINVEENIANSKNQESKVHWKILTNHEIKTVEQAKEVISFYKSRWVIEMLFAINKKKGLDIESTQIENFDKLQKFILIALHASIKIFYLLKSRDNSIKSSASLIFSEHEIFILSKILITLQGKTIKQTNCYDKGSMSWASWIIARLGGWNCYGKTRPPGIHTFWRGLQKFYNMYEGAKIACL